MHRTRKVFAALAGIALLWAAVPLAAQQGRGRGRIRGSVEDEAGNPLPNVKITAEHMEYGTKFEGKSDKKGNWAIGGLGSGNFQITGELEGYAPSSVSMTVSQFSANNLPVALTLKKIQAVPTGSAMPGLEDEASLATFEEGNSLYGEEKFAEAAAKFEEFLSLNPKIYQVNINLANCYREMGDYEKALSTYNGLLDTIMTEKGTLEGDETAARALAGIGQTHMKAGDLDRASEYLQQAMTAMPNDEALAFNIGEIYFTQQQPDKAIEFYTKATELKPDWASPWRQLGYAYLNKAEYQAALDSFKKFLEVAPDDPLAPTIENLLPTLQGLIKK